MLLRHQRDIDVRTPRLKASNLGGDCRDILSTDCATEFLQTIVAAMEGGRRAFEHRPVQLHERGADPTPDANETADAIDHVAIGAWPRAVRDSPGANRPG